MEWGTVRGGNGGDLPHGEISLGSKIVLLKYVNSIEHHIIPTLNIGTKLETIEPRKAVSHCEQYGKTIRTKNVMKTNFP